MVKCFIKDEEIRWDRYLSLVVYRLSVYEVIGMILNFFMLGCELRMLLDMIFEESKIN